MNHTRFFVTAFILSFIATSVLVAGSLPVMGAPFQTQLSYVKGAVTSATVTVTAVKVEPQGDRILLKIYLTYMNNRKRSVLWNFEDTAVLVAQDRQFEGKAEFAAMSTRSTIDFIQDLEPGLTKKTYVYYRLPKSALNGNLRFCFLKLDKSYTPQCMIQIYDKKKSSFKFDRTETFKSVAWE